MTTPSLITRRHPNDVRDAVSRLGISKTELVTITGLNKNTLTGVERDDWNPRWKTLEKLCLAIDSIQAIRNTT